MADPLDRWTPNATPSADPLAGWQGNATPTDTQQSPRSILNTSWLDAGKQQPWDVPGGGALPQVQPQAGTGGWERYVDPSLAPSQRAGDFLPFSNEPGKGLRLALPNIFRGLTTEGPQLNDQGKLVVPGATINPATGTLGVTPEAALTGSLATSVPPEFRTPQFVPPGTFRRPVDLGGASIMPGMPPGGPLPGGATTATGIPAPPSIQMSAVNPPPLPPGTPTTVAAGRAIEKPWWNIVDQNPGAAVAPDYATQQLDAAIKKLQPAGPTSAAVGSSNPANQLAIDLAAGRNQPMTLADFVDTDRNISDLKNAALAAGRNNTARRIGEVQADLREGFEGAGPENVVGGQEGFDALDPARQAHTQTEKMSDLEAMLYKAGLKGDTEGSSIKSQIVSYLTSDQSRNLTDMERAAYETALKRGALGTGLLGLKQLSSPLLGAVVGGPKLALAAEVSRGITGSLSNALARGRVQNVAEEIGKGYPSPPPPVPPAAQPWSYSPLNIDPGSIAAASRAAGLLNLGPQAATAPRSGPMIYSFRDGQPYDAQGNPINPAARPPG